MDGGTLGEELLAKNRPILFSFDNKWCSRRRKWEGNEGRQKVDQGRKSGNAVNTRSQGSASNKAVAKHEYGKRQEGRCKTKYLI
jgi:hypothetical protein